MQSISSYINPNTRGLTSNYKNTAIKDKETYNEAMSQHLLNPVEDLVQVLKTPIKLAKSSSLSRQNNSVNIAEGQRIRVNGGHVLTATAHGVEVSGGDNPYDTQSYVKAQRMADALASMLRNAGGTMTTVAHSKEEYARYTEGITDVMSYLGIDTSKDFTVNGMKYSKNKDGWYESEANSEAQAAYEQLKANNRTYQFADEKTKKQIAYISDYYLQTVPESVKAAWQETLEETGVNPFQTDLSSTLTQLSKKSTVMDSYLALSGKTINTLKQEYSEYESENYRIVPDNEAECFDIYNKDGERLGAFSYSDIKIRQDETTGKQFLISEHGTMSYDALVLDDELKDALQNVMDKDSLDVETLQGFTLNTHSGTGIQYLVKDGEEGRGGKVLLQNEADRKRYEELAEMYFDKYPNLIESREEGFIWADLEIRGMAKRTDQGIISIGADGMSYSDNENYKNNWSVRFSGSMYEKLYEWLQNNKDSMEEIHKFSTWQKVFDEIGGTYERVWSKEELDQGYLNN